MLRSPHTNLFFSLSLSLFLSIHLLFQRPLSSLASLGESTLARLTKHMQPKNGPDCREKNAIYFLQASLDDDICACWLYLNTTHLLSPNRGSGERCTRTPWSGLRKPVNFFFLFFFFLSTLPHSCFLSLQSSYHISLLPQLLWFIYFAFRPKGHRLALCEWERKRNRAAPLNLGIDWSQMRTDAE